MDVLNGSLLNLSLEPDLQQELQEEQIDANRKARKTNRGMHKEVPLCKRFHKVQPCMQMYEKKGANKLEEVC